MDTLNTSIFIAAFVLALFYAKAVRDMRSSIPKNFKDGE